MALKKLKWLKYLFVNETEAQTEQMYWNEKRKKHLKNEHSVGISEGLVVEQDIWQPSKTVIVSPGRALDYLGNDPELEQANYFNMELAVPTSGTRMVYLVLNYTQAEIEPYFVNEINSTQNKYVEDRFEIDMKLVEPTEQEIELARIEVSHDIATITDAVDPANPQVNEIDLRFRKYSGKEVLSLVDLFDVAPNQAAAFAGMVNPGIYNPIATISKITDAVSPINNELAIARGTHSSLDARLDVMLNDNGSFKGITEIGVLAPLTGGGNQGHVSIGINPASQTTPGSMSAQDKLKLDGIEAGATSDMTASEIVNLISSSGLLQFNMLGDISANEAAALNAAGSAGASASNRIVVMSDMTIQQAIYG